MKLALFVLHFVLGIFFKKTFRLAYVGGLDHTVSYCYNCGTRKYYLLFNRMTISDYNTKPALGDRAILFLKLHGFT